jgi:CRP-like cAMP-binding protein
MSLLAVADGDVLAEVATIGNEGLVGVPVFLGAGTIPALAFVQIPGESLRVPVPAFREQAAPGRPLHLVVQRYTQALFNQVAQAVVCNVAHTAEQRCCRWILMTRDRVSRDEFPLTHEFLAQMLAVRRATVTETAGALQREGLIRYRRGIMEVKDLDRLEQRACGCYRTIRREYERLLGDGSDQRRTAAGRRRPGSPRRRPSRRGAPRR